MMNIVVLDGFTLNPGDLSWDGIAALGNLTVYDRTSPDEIYERALPADILLTNKVVLDAEIIGKLPELKYIGVLATGYNVVDIEAARKRNILVSNIPAYSTMSVVQQVFALLLSVTNHAEHYAIENRSGKWTHSTDFCYTDFPLIELAGKQFGIVGFGAIGSKVAAVANAFGMNVATFSSKSEDELPGYVKKMDLDTLLSTSDVISLHCPLTESTRNMIDSRSISKMKSSAILINTGRGPLINEADLAEALNNGRIYAAAMDVLSSEPPAADNPLITARNCFISPHIAWASKEARARLMEIETGNIRSFLNGEAQNIVS